MYLVLYILIIKLLRVIYGSFVLNLCGFLRFCVLVNVSLRLKGRKIKEIYIGDLNFFYELIF